ncbi:hypothetical protein I549_4288 [Mycobacterium avium subsp. avium 2285 (R)]|nr:hypothetical protein I549_4288 [Mycobacterium avium subsp. avium 2285 (R)]
MSSTCGRSMSVTSGRILQVISVPKRMRRPRPAGGAPPQNGG